MKKNKKGGKKFKKGKKLQFEKTVMIFKEEGEEYAKVDKLLGNGRLNALIQDGTSILCIIPGRLKKKKWIRIGDIILINIRDYQKDKADVLHCYTDSQVMTLRNQKLLPKVFNNIGDTNDNSFSDNIVFSDEPLDNNDNVDNIQDNNKESIVTDKIAILNESGDDLEDDIDIEDI